MRWRRSTPYRFDWATPMLRALRIGATNANELPYVWANFVVGRKDGSFKLGGLKSRQGSLGPPPEPLGQLCR